MNKDNLISFTILFLIPFFASLSFFSSWYKNFLKSIIFATGGFALAAIKTKSNSWERAV
jgi:hypothetical protein